MEEYFQTDVKSEDDFDIEIEPKELKYEFIFDSDKEGMTEYFETDVVKSEVWQWTYFNMHKSIVAFMVLPGLVFICFPY